MNHKVVETWNQSSTSRVDVHYSPTQPNIKKHYMDVEGEIDKGAEKTNRLLAAILVFYKDAMINPIAPLYPPQLLQELDICLQTEPSLASQNISNGTTDLEHRSAEVALKFIDLESTTPIVDRLFYAMVNLTRPSQSFRDSIEFNAKAIFNVIIASIVQGAQVHDCERLLTLCIHLKDTEDCYPLRSLASSICLEMICSTPIPLFARTSTLRFILGPASFILHHLETRIIISEKISRLLQESSFEDIEFRSLVQRIAKKIGVLRQTSVYEQTKFRGYCYLNLVVSDPTRYCRQDIITEYLTSAQLKSILDHDIVFYLNLNEHRSSILLFLEVIRAMGFSLSAFDPSPVQKAIIGTQDFVNDAMTHLYIARQRVCSALESHRSVHESLNAALGLTLDIQDPTSDIQLHLDKASNMVSLSIQPLNLSSLKSNLEQVLRFSRQLLQISIVGPTQLLPRILWMASVCLRTCEKLQEDMGLKDPKIRETSAVCLDVFLACLVHRNEPRFCASQTEAMLLATAGDQSQQRIKADLDMALSLFVLLFPAPRTSTWSCMSTVDSPQAPVTTTGSSICAEFLLQLFKYLVPLLERIDQAEGSQSTVIWAGLLLEVLSLQIPTVVLVQEQTEILDTLNSVADLQKDSTLSMALVWKEMFGTERSSHPLQGLQARLRLLAQEYS
ncbi:hypothetical protein EDD21DRAFT_84482 [Dissophora ornata]|nr:hypothetical protein EDD21DRAFT_84482 [Dissophora ornata]